MKNVVVLCMVVVIFLLSACGTSTGSGASQSIFKDGVATFVHNQYPLLDVVASGVDSSNYSEVYLAEGKSIDEVARELQDYQTPVKVSEKNENKQVLVYKELFVILTLDEENSGNALIELADKEFVRNNYSPGFFEGMLLMRFLDDVLDVDDWGKRRKSRCSQFPTECYGGYNQSGGSFRGYQKTPVRGGTSTVRGGGPGSGK